jgi:diguanylate cyclase (GGDEF)-like protein
VQDADNNIFACNQSTVRILGFPEADIKVRNDADSAWKPCMEDGTPIPTEELPSIKALRTGQPVRNFSVRIVRGNGELAWVRVSAVPLFRMGEPRPYQVVTSFVDITGLKQQQHELVSQASTDFLTGIANRRVLAVKGEEAFKAAAAGAQLAVLAIDVDHFKAVNDKFGHAVGDEALKIVVARIKDYTRDDDLVVRMGGEEFCVLLPDTSNDMALAIAERIRQAIAAAPLLQVGQEPLTVTLSTGLVSHKRGVDQNLAALLSRGDNALYQAKHSGRNRVVVLH